jgi:hypothetical protein
MLIKKIFRLAAVLCLFFFSAQMVQAQQLKGQELVDWIKSKTWILFEFTDNEGRTGNYGSKYPLEQLILQMSMSRFDGCNTCYSSLEFDIKTERVSRSNEMCTEKDCPPASFLEPEYPTLMKPLPNTTAEKDVKKHNDDFVLHTLYIGNMHYKKEGEYLILSDETGKYKLKAM